MNTKFIIIYLIILILVGCENPTKVDQIELQKIQQKGEEFFPLGVGNFWEYEKYEYENDTLIVKRNITLEVVNEINILWEADTISVYEIQRSTTFPEYDNLIEVIYFLYRNESDGIYRYGHSLDDNHNYYYKKVLYIKNPIEVGDTWYEDHGDYRDRFQCVSINDTVTVENKDFECIRIRMGGNGSWYSDSFFTKGVGLLQNISEVYGTYYKKQLLVRSVIK